MMKTISLFGSSFQSSQFLWRKIPIISCLEDVFCSFVPSPFHMRAKKYCLARTFSPHHINFKNDDARLESKQFKRLSLSSRSLLSQRSNTIYRRASINSLAPVNIKFTHFINIVDVSFLPSPKIFNKRAPIDGT